MSRQEVVRVHGRVASMCALTAKGRVREVRHGLIDRLLFGEAGFQLRKLGDKLRMSGHFVLASVLKGLENVFGTFSARSQRKNLIHALGPTEAKMWMYFNHIHSKQMNFDQIMTSTGSFNLDSYSYRNHESTMICLDKKLSDESMVGFVSDIVNSTPVFSK
jgi:phosphatidylserine/phosphatidylglycerophosphate/cardiolipin synthase-like enzyme